MPINFNFGAEWDSVKHFLEDPEVDEIIKKAHKKLQYQRFLKNRNINRQKFDPNRSPSDQLSTFDSWIKLLDHICEIYDDIDHMPEENFQNDKEDDESEDEFMWDMYWQKRQNTIREAGYDWPKHKDKLAFYIPFGSCHAWNSIFGLWLARKVFPDLKWEVLAGKNHTTVYCKNRDMIFDIIYWGLDNRIEDYIAKKPYSSNDKSFGGNLAFENATKDD